MIASSRHTGWLSPELQAPEESQETDFRHDVVMIDIVKSQDLQDLRQQKIVKSSNPQKFSKSEIRLRQKTGERSERETEQIDSDLRREDVQTSR